MVVGEAGMRRHPDRGLPAGRRDPRVDRGRRLGPAGRRPSGLTEAAGRLVGDDAERKRLGKGAREMSHTFSWAHSQESFAHVLADVLAGRRVAVEDPDGP